MRRDVSSEEMATDGILLGDMSLEETLTNGTTSGELTDEVTSDELFTDEALSGMANGKVSTTTKNGEVKAKAGRESGKSKGGLNGKVDRTSYNAEDIQTLKDLEAVRKRPGMYIGGTGQEGFMHLIWELIDNAIDEASAGFCNRLEVTFHRDGSVEVSDNGRGVPIGIHPDKKKVTALEVVFTELHAGGKFKTGAYGATGGLHGVGASVVNALSEKMEVEVDRERKTWKLDFQNGVAGIFNGKKFSKTHELKKVKSISPTKTGTRVRFWPNREIFDTDVSFDYEEVCARLRRACCLVPGLKAKVTDKRTGAEKSPAAKTPFEFVSRAGLLDLLKENLKSGAENLADDIGEDTGENTGGKKQKSSSQKTTINKPIIISGISSFTETVQVDGKATKLERECELEIALFWTDSFQANVQSFVNTIPTKDGGTHIAGFDKALIFAANKTLLANTKKLASLAKKSSSTNLAKKEDIYEGLMAAVKVTFPEPQFKGQTKQELGTPEIQSIVYKITSKSLISWFEKDGPKAHVNAIRDKIANAIIAREAARETRDNKRRSAMRTSATGMPDKLADCRTHGPDAELILVEGESAAGPAKAGRDSEYMAILPLRGKVVNAAKASARQVLDNTEAQALFASLGAGSGEAFDPDAARYGRIIILCDADVDGSHIRCLLLTLIYKYLRPMLESGRVFAAQPPLYTTKVGGEIYRAFSDGERDAITAELAKGNRKVENIRWQRFKGLGEMNVDELAHCALNPETRILRRMDLADVKASEAMIEKLMGRDASKRREHLVEHSSLMDPDILDV